MSHYIQPRPAEGLTIDTSQMIEVDRLMMQEYHIELIQMMENAGRGLAIVAREVFLDGDPQDKRIAVLAGTGGNGGGALVCARRLHNWGAQVEVFLTDTAAHMAPIPGHQLRSLQRMGLPIQLGDPLPSAGSYHLLIDGLIGYSVKGDPYGLPGAMIRWVNARPEAVLSLDTPSGLDLTTGTVHDPTVRADATLTLAMPKQGLFQAAAKPLIGQLYLADISVPPQLYAEPSLGLRAENVFRYTDVVRISPSSSV
jgi:NAD(P)H-hydrate epimerase